MIDCLSAGLFYYGALIATDFLPLCGAFLHVFLPPSSGIWALHVFENCQKPGGGMGTLRFD